VTYEATRPDAHAKIVDEASLAEHDRVDQHPARHGCEDDAHLGAAMALPGAAGSDGKGPSALNGRGLMLAARAALAPSVERADDREADIGRAGELRGETPIAPAAPDPRHERILIWRAFDILDERDHREASSHGLVELILRRADTTLRSLAILRAQQDTTTSQRPSSSSRARRESSRLAGTVSNITGRICNDSTPARAAARTAAISPRANELINTDSTRVSLRAPAPSLPRRPSCTAARACRCKIRQEMIGRNPRTP
jgi:hypothetical protein